MASAGGHWVKGSFQKAGGGATNKKGRRGPPGSRAKVVENVTAGVKPETAYDKQLVRTGNRATNMGIKAHDTSGTAMSMAREAAAEINSRSSVGYTVYATSTNAYTTDSKGNMVDQGVFAMVGVGAGTTKGEQTGMIRHLRSRGWKATTGPEGSGIIVGG